MYDLLIPEVIRTFSLPGESESTFLQRVREADIRLSHGFRTGSTVCSDRYREAMLRAAYLLRYLGHYTLQLGDLLVDLEGTAAGPILARRELRLAALCGGPCPEAIALASLHQQAGGRRLTVDVLDRNAVHWSDCWPISRAIARAYPGHHRVTISGLAIDLLQPGCSPEELGRLAKTDVFTAMNCLNELMGLDKARLRAGLQTRLDALPPGTLLLASDQAGYSACEQGIRLFHDLLQQRGATVLLAELDPSQPHTAENRLACPERIAGLYGEAGRNNFRIWTRSLRLAACLP